MRDFNPKTIILGIILGAVFGSANAYLGLRVGLTISTAIPLAVVSVAILRILTPIFGKPTILECNISQTTGSASSSLASGLIFTVPALFIWGYDAPLLQITLLAICGGTLGVLFMIPLRNFLIVKEHKTLPYPEGTASAEVLIAATGGGGASRVDILGPDIVPLPLALEHLDQAVFHKKGRCRRLDDSGPVGCRLHTRAAYRRDHGRRRPGLVGAAHPVYRLEIR
jgi:putative OPT family oligopeptide transporter